jgi:antitoxin component YwqK of YwqJK toxin-antitoxin module
MSRGVLLATFFCLHTFCYSQKIPLVNSGDVIARGKALYDSSKFADAAKEYLKVPERDTNYVYMLTELALAYIGDEKYEQALAICDQALKHRSEHRAHLLRSQAVATDKKGDTEAAIKLFHTAIQEFPTDPLLLFNLGITYYNHKDYETAQEIFFKVLSISPFHAGSHLNLGRIAIGQGRKTHGMLSLGLYLSISEMDNSSLIWLNNFVDNQLTDEGQLPVFGTNGAEKLDQIIRAKIVLDQNFKSKIPVTAPVVKQYEMLFEQLHTINKETDDPWIKYYYSIFQTIKDQNEVAPFIYHLLTSANNDVVRKWLSKNEKSLSVFYDIMNREIKKKSERILLPEYGFTKPAMAWYDDANLLYAIGEDPEAKHVGKWVTFHDNHTISAEGEFDQKGNKTGIWHYFSSNGSVKSQENYETGEMMLYDDKGNKQQHYFLKDERTNGEVELYYPCGLVKERLLYKDDERDGKGEAYYPSGKVEITYQYTNGKATGEFVSYYENAQVSNRSNYKDDKLDGRYISFFENGKLKNEGQYLVDEQVGLWKYYYSNGKIDYTGNYVKDTPVGEWTYYNSGGSLIETRLFNEKGQLHGDNIIFKSGKKHSVTTYKDGLLVRVMHFNSDGKELGRGENKDGTFSIKEYFITGQLRSEGTYKKGKQHGTWRYYFRNGKLQNELMYEDGLIQGAAKEYYESGEQKHASNYKDNELDGYFQKFYSHGQVQSEGWFQNGERIQQWKTYYSDGALQSDDYYLRDDFHGKCDNYAVDGKLYSSIEYDKGMIMDIKHYDRNGLPVTQKSATDIVSFSDLYANGKPRLQYELLCGSYTGNVTHWLFNGNVLYRYGMAEGKKHGDYAYYFLNGKISAKGKFRDGEEYGKWENFYENGSMSSYGIYLDGKRDSTWLYNYPDGTINMRIEFSDNDRQGITAIFAPEGEPLLEKLYDNGDLILYRVKDRESWSEWMPFAGTGKITATYPDGTIAYEETYEDHLRHGYKKSYYKNGKVCDESNYVKGDFEGSYALYFSNGNVREKGSYKKDERDGIVEYFNEDGSPLGIETYKMDVRNGKAAIYKKGVKTNEFTFWDGITYE